jgi:hypothetical protein
VLTQIIGMNLTPDGMLPIGEGDQSYAHDTLDEEVQKRPLNGGIAWDVRSTHGVDGSAGVESSATLCALALDEPAVGGVADWRCECGREQEGNGGKGELHDIGAVAERLSRDVDEWMLEKTSGW